MRLRACTVIFASSLALMPVAAGAAETPLPAAMATLALKDGRILHNVRVMSDEGASVVVRADEGLLKISKADLPQAVTSALPEKAPTSDTPEYVMQRFDPNQAPEAPPPEPGAKPKAKPAAIVTPAPRPAAIAVYKGCTIISFEKKSFENVLGCALVVIQNDSDENTQIRAADFACITADGQRHIGRNLFANTFPPSVKRREYVPSHGQLEDIVTFSNDNLDISSVQWSR